MVKQLSTTELAQMILKKQESLVLDIRSADEVKNGKISGKGIQVIHLPYDQINQEIDYFEDAIAKDQPFLIVSTDGQASLELAKVLERTGYTKVSHLVGGMNKWHKHIEPVKIGDLSSGGRLYQFIRLGNGDLSYLIESSGEAMIIDPTSDAAFYLSFIKDHNLYITHIVDTHLHGNHVSAALDLLKQTEAKYHFPKRDLVNASFYADGLDGGQNLSLGHNKVTIQPFFTPGHTKGSTSIIVDGRYVLTGDSLYLNSVPYPEYDVTEKEDLDVLAGELYDSIFRKLKNLNEAKIILPSHFNSIDAIGSTGKVFAPIEEIFQRLRQQELHDKETFKQFIKDHIGPISKNVEAIYELNLGKGNREAAHINALESEIGANLYEAVQTSTI